MEAETKSDLMIQFIHKFEPLYIQRQITQALNYVFPDSTV